jgi:acyl-CoA hydrolase
MTSTPEVSVIPWESKEIKLEDVPDKIPNGSNVYIGSCSSTPEAVLNALVEHWKSTDIQILQMIPGGNLPHMKENIDRFRTSSFFSLSKTMYLGLEKINTSKKMEGLADYRPMSYSSVPRLLKENIVSVDVAVIKVTPPHKGFVSLGCGVEHTMSFIRHAKVVVAEVNIHMPWTEGHSKLRVQDIDWWVQHDQPLLTTEQLWPDLLKDHDMNRYPQEVIDAIGENLVKLIPDGATLKFGWSPMSYVVLPFLHRRKNLGLHTDVLLEDMFRLHESGVFNNSLKTLDTGRAVVSQAHGSADLYEYLDRNPAIEFRSSDYVNDPLTLGKMDNLIVIEGALKVRSWNV